MSRGAIWNPDPVANFARFNNNSGFRHEQIAVPRFPVAREECTFSGVSTLPNCRRVMQDASFNMRPGGFSMGGSSGSACKESVVRVDLSRHGASLGSGPDRASTLIKLKILSEETHGQTVTTPVPDNDQ